MTITYIPADCCCAPDDTGTGTGTIPPTPVGTSCCPGFPVPRTLCFEMRNIDAACPIFDWTGALELSIPPPGPPGIIMEMWWACRSINGVALGFPSAGNLSQLIRMFCADIPSGTRNWHLSVHLLNNLFSVVPCSPNTNTELMTVFQPLGDPVAASCDPFCLYNLYESPHETGNLSIPCLPNAGTFDGTQFELYVYDCDYGPEYCFPDTGTGTGTGGWYCWSCSGGIVPACNQSSTEPPFEGCVFVGGPYATEEECFAACGSPPAAPLPPPPAPAVLPSRPASVQPGGVRARMTLPCVHLGEPTGERRDCVKCGGGKQIPLYECGVHGECTRERELVYRRGGRPEKAAWCVTCPQYAPR